MKQSGGQWNERRQKSGAKKSEFNSVGVFFCYFNLGSFCGWKSKKIISSQFSLESNDFWKQEDHFLFVNPIIVAQRNWNFVHARPLMSLDLFLISNVMEFLSKLFKFMNHVHHQYTLFIGLLIHQTIFTRAHVCAAEWSQRREVCCVSIVSLHRSSRHQISKAHECQRPTFRKTLKTIFHTAVEF